MRILKKPVSYCLSIFSVEFPAPFSFRVLRLSPGIPARRRAIHTSGVSWSISWKILRLRS
ncbi:hypothetical protein SLEP1_g38904 [Rubroshorea leprosula]|uniref:Uncharacterized protein n=1 Tax=Rubroshorea leprosula TaxID=152421 RepID=A0AAV5KZ74_9ROSI|nr:hypothetical protein SLEP1_g38904 [Rubroshorea leprosula]